MAGRKDDRDDGLDVPDPARLLAERAERERTASGSWRAPSREGFALDANLEAFHLTEDPDTDVTPPTAIPGTMSFDLEWEDDDGRTFDDALVADAEAPTPLSGHVEPSEEGTAAPTWDDAMAAESEADDEPSGAEGPDASVGEPVGTAVPDRGTAVDTGRAVAAETPRRRPPARRGPSTTGVLLAVIFFLASVIVVLLTMR